jgi:hypothetical protein
MQDSDLPDALWLDAEQRVVGDMSCVACGYNLRTLPADGACPECSRRVRDSLPLRLQPVGWLKRLRLGATLFLLSYLLLPVQHLVLASMSGISPRIVGQRVDPSAWWYLGVTVALAGRGTVLLAAFWLLTSREPSTISPRPLAGRRLARMLIPAALVTTWVSGACSGGVSGPVGYFATLIANVANSILTVVLVLSWLAFIVSLAWRVPSRLLRRFAKLAMVCYLPLLVCDVFFSVLQLAEAVAEPPPRLPYAFEEFSGSGSRGGEYIIYEESGAMVRTTTVPASLLLPPSTRPAWLEKLYASVSTEANWRVYEGYGVITDVAGLTLAGLVWWVLLCALRQRRALERDASSTAARRAPD